MVITAENIWKHYGGHAAVCGLHFSVPHGVCFGLLGPNGAGKSTMMKMVFGVSRRDESIAGSLSVFGLDPNSDSLSIKFRSGVVPQENNLDEELDVEQNLKIYARFYDIPPAVAKKRIDELLAFMELGDKRDAAIKHLSGGMKRRLVIARALINNPALLILDEPTTGLDPQVRQSIWEKLRALKRKGMTILLTTHYMEEAFQICDSVLIMNKGAKIVEGNPRRLVREQIEHYVMELYTKDSFSQLAGLLPKDRCRVDSSTEVIRVYSDNYELLHQLSRNLAPGDLFLRQSNLEDLFLKSTGSSINAQQ